MGRPDFIDWATSRGGVYLPDKREPTLATWQPYQVDILRYIFPPGIGRLPYSEIIWSEPKKSGKTLLAAAVQLFFALFVDVPGEQYVLANDLEGASDRTWQSIKRSLEAVIKVPKSGIRDNDWWTVGTKIILSNGSEIKALANDYKGGAGGNQSLATVDEVWGFTQSKDLGLLTEFAPVPTRENSTTFYTGYQGYEGEANYWHDMIDGVLRNGEPVPELAHIGDGDGKPACWRDGRAFLFFSHLPRQPWQDEAYLKERRKRMVASEYLRVWENRRTKNANAICSEDQWDRLLDMALRALYDDDRRVLVLGADAATKRDCCALVGVTVNPATGKYEVVFVKIWTPDPNQPIKLTETIGPEIVRLHLRYNVAACYYDPFQMAGISELCIGKGVKMVEFPQGPRRIESDTHLRDLIIGNNLAHYGDTELKDHVTSALVKSESERGVRIFKDFSRKKVDAAVALAMAALGAKEVLLEQSSELSAEENPFYGALDTAKETKSWDEL